MPVLRFALLPLTLMIWFTRRRLPVRAVLVLGVLVYLGGCSEAIETAEDTRQLGGHHGQTGYGLEETITYARECYGLSAGTCRSWRVRSVDYYVTLPYPGAQKTGPFSGRAAAQAWAEAAINDRENGTDTASALAPSSSGGGSQASGAVAADEIEEGIADAEDAADIDAVENTHCNTLAAQQSLPECY